MRGVGYGCALVALLMASSACEKRLEGDELIAAKADYTTRQLLAGLNADKKEVLPKLVVVTSTSGGAPRALGENELTQVVYPKPPYTYLGAGPPGYVFLRDGSGQKRSIQIIETESLDLRVLAREMSLAAYTQLESGGSGAAPAGVDVRVITFIRTAEEAERAK